MPSWEERMTRLSALSHFGTTCTLEMVWKLFGHARATSPPHDVEVAYDRRVSPPRRAMSEMRNAGKVVDWTVWPDGDQHVGTCGW